MTVRSALRTLHFPAAACLLLLVGCGDGEDGVGGPLQFPGGPVIDSVQLGLFAGTATNEMQVLLHTLYGGQHEATPNVFLLPPLGAAVAAPAGAMRVAMEGCTPTETGIDTLGFAIDSDGDAVPDDYTVDFGTGCSQMVDGLEYTFEGKYRYQDNGVGLLDLSYTTTGLSAMVRDTTTGTFFRQRVTGTETAHFTESHAAHQMDVTLEVTSRNGADSTHVKLRTKESSTYDADSGSTFQLHGRLPQGTLVLHSELTFEDLGIGAAPVRFVQSTLTPIHLAFDCGTGFDAGKLQGLDDGDFRVGFRFTWNGCGAPLFEMFGATP